MEPGEDRFHGNKEMALLQEVQKLAGYISEAQSARGRLAHEIEQWRAFGQRLTGVDANDCGWLRAEMESQWMKRDAYAEQNAAILKDARSVLRLADRSEAWRAERDRVVAEIDAALDKNPAIIGIDKGRPGGDKTVEVHAHRDANGGIVIDKMIESEPRDALTEEIPLPDFAILQRRPMLLAVLDEASELLRGFPPGEMRDMRRRIDHEAAMIRALPASQMEPCEEKR
jgi:hypothetical protein